MNKTLPGTILGFLRGKVRNRRWRHAVVCMASVVVFAVTYAMILPAITMTKEYPTLEAEETLAWSGDELAVKVTAGSEPGTSGKTVVLTMEGEGADLSGSYAFNKEGICLITDSEGQEIELHRSIREEEAKNASGEKVNRIDYWFILEAGQETSFTLELIDEVDENRFAEIVKAVKMSGEENAEDEKATASDAGRSEVVVKKASVSDAEKASGSNAATASGSNAATETDDDGFAQLLDDVIENDLDQEEEDEEQTEIVAELNLSAGSGKDYESAVRDAAKNAGKRNRDGMKAELKLQWQDAVTTKLFAEENDANIAVFYDRTSGIPHGASLEVREIEEGTEDYERYLAEAGAAIAGATGSNASRSVSFARFFDITIVGEDGSRIQPEKGVRVFITYDEKIQLTDDSDLNVVHFNEDEETTEVMKPGKPEGTDEVDGLAFTAKSFSVYGIIGTGMITTQYLSSNGNTYEITVAYHQDAKIPEGAKLKVTEFADGSPEYNETRKAVLADKYKKGEWVDLNDFGFAALDISILNAAGEEIEPEAEVQVSMKIKSLPGVEKIEDVSDSLEVQHHVETEGGVVVETVSQGLSKTEFGLETDDAVAAKGAAVDPKNFDEKAFDALETEMIKESGIFDASDIEEFFAGEKKMHDSSGEKIFVINSFSRFTLTWYHEGNRKANIHYGYMNGNAFVEFPDSYIEAVGDDTTNSGYKYLNYDIEGYYYKDTYLKRNDTLDDPTTGTHIAPVLRYSDDAFRYYAFSESTPTESSTGTTSTVANTSKAANIYVIYEEIKDSTDGGTPTLKENTGVEEDLIQNHKPTITKTSGINGDGTNTISLTVEGFTEEIEAEKLADVIVVYDNSSSMRTQKLNSERRWKIARQQLIALSNTLLGKNDRSHPELIRMALVTFDCYARLDQGFTTSAGTFQTYIPEDPNNSDGYSNGTKGRLTSGGTNWEAALRVADTLECRSNAATFVIFLTDGNPTLRFSRMGISNTNLRSTTAVGDYPANREADNHTGDPHGRDGHLNAVRGYPSFRTEDNTGLWSRSLFGDLDNDAFGANFYGALDEAQSIIEHGKHFYSIGFSEAVTRLESFTSLAYGGGLHDDSPYYYDAANAQKLEEAFNDIAASIVATVGYSDIKIDDGITGLTNTVEKSGLTDVDGNFEYFKRTKNKNGTWPAWAPWSAAERAAEGCADAVYQNGSVKWDMGASFMLEKDVQYRVSFKVWPKQEAYDIIAKLNNGTLNYGELDSTIRAQIKPDGSGGYYLITNEESAGYTYKMARKTGDTVTPISDPYSGKFDPVDNLNLLPTTIAVQKDFINNLDPDDYPKPTIRLDLVPADDEEDIFKSITLAKSNQWRAADNYISPGLMKTSGASNLIIYEYGHEFTLKEVDYHWDLTVGTYRPMIINNDLKILERTGSNSSTKKYSTNGGVTSYWIPDYRDEEGNLVTGGVYKEVASASAKLSAVNYRRSNLNLTKNVVDGSGNSLNDKYADELFEFTITVDADEDVYFSVQTDPNNPSTVVIDLDTDADPELDEYGVPKNNGFFCEKSGTPIKVKMKPTWNLRFTNLPTGTTYTIIETDRKAEGFPFSKAKLIKGTDTTFKAPPQTDGATKVTGTIQNVNTQYQVEYTNTCTIVDIRINKTDAGAVPAAIGGARFNLYKLNASNNQYELMNDYKNFEIPVEGIDCTKLVIGKYKLEEVSAPAGYIIVNKDTVFTLNASSPTIVPDEGQSWASVSGDTRNILNIQNQAGAELPATGGRGTTIFFVIGSILVIGAGVFIAARRRIEARWY